MRCIFIHISISLPALARAYTVTFKSDPNESPISFMAVNPADDKCFGMRGESELAAINDLKSVEVQSDNPFRTIASGYPLPRAIAFYKSWGIKLLDPADDSLQRSCDQVDIATIVRFDEKKADWGLSQVFQTTYPSRINKQVGRYGPGDWTSWKSIKEGDAEWKIVTDKKMKPGDVYQRFESVSKASEVLKGLVQNKKNTSVLVDAFKNMHPPTWEENRAFEGTYDREQRMDGGANEERKSQEGENTINRSFMILSDPSKLGSISKQEEGNLILRGNEGQIDVGRAERYRDILESIRQEVDPNGKIFGPLIGTSDLEDIFQSFKSLLEPYYEKRKEDELQFEIAPKEEEPEIFVKDPFQTGGNPFERSTPSRKRDQMKVKWQKLKDRVKEPTPGGLRESIKAKFKKKTEDPDLGPLFDNSQ